VWICRQLNRLDWPEWVISGELAQLASEPLAFCFGRETHVTHPDGTPAIDLAGVFATALCLISSRPKYLDQRCDAHVYTVKQPTVGMTELRPLMFNKRQL
jgi:hypothetical protein